MDARELALKVVNDVDVNGAYANIALAKALGRQALSDQDRRFATELIYGTVRAGATLDWFIGHYSSRPAHKIAPIIRNILRLGMYQIFFLDKVPVSAACNEAVNLTKKYGHQGTVKFVNAVLRNAARHPEKAAFPERENNLVQYLALKYFHPEWLVKIWLERLGPLECEKLLEVNNITPPLSLRTNTLKATRDEILNDLRSHGVECEPSHWTPEGILCSSYPSLGSFAPLQNGLVQVQDESSMLVGHVLSAQPGEFVIDTCGAPGGKSTHIAALMNNCGRVLSTDLHDHKLALTRDNSTRLGIDIIETRALDATQIGELYTAQADRVLVDAPCSGLGVIRRKPDSRWRKTEALLKDLPKLQLAILQSAAQCVKKGGILVYSTCTTEPQENEYVVNRFLADRDDFALQPAGRYLPVPSDAEMIQLWPHVHNIDGFFISRLVRVK